MSAASPTPLVGPWQQGHRRTPHSIAMEPASLLQDTQPFGTADGVPSGLVVLPGHRTLQPSPVHLPTYSSQRCLPGPLHLHQRLHWLQPAGRQGVHQVPRLPRLHEAGVLSPERPRGSLSLCPPRHLQLPILCARVQSRPLPPQPHRGLPHKLPLQVQAQDSLQHR